MSETEVKLELKKPLIGYNSKAVKNTDNVRQITQQNPTLSQEQLLDLCPDMILGDVLPGTLLSIEIQDVKEKLKLFRWASKMEDKLITAKGEMPLDLNQVTELYDFISKSTTLSTNVLAPILIIFEGLKEKLTAK